MAQTGTTTGNLKLRSGPGLQFEPPLAYLEPNTALEVLSEDGDWLRVRVKGKEGYVGKKYVSVSAAVSSDTGSKPAADPRSDLTKRSAPPPAKPGTAGKAHKGVEKE